MMIVYTIRTVLYSKDVYKRQERYSSMICVQPFSNHSIYLYKSAWIRTTFLLNLSLGDLHFSRDQKSKPVSYTHLDVYKRQSVTTTKNLYCLYIFDAKC